TIMRLTDQAPGMSAANRLLVAPYYGEGAQIGYPVVADANNDLNNLFTFVGYGDTGTGGTGIDQATPFHIKRLGVNTFDADANVLNNSVQTVGITGTPNGGFFRLTYTPPGGAAATTTGNIPWNATAAQVQAALLVAVPGLANNVV